MMNKTFNHLCTYRHALRKISISLSMERCDGWKDGRELPMHSWIIRMAPSGHVVPLIASPGIHTHTQNVPMTTDGHQSQVKLKVQFC